MRPPEIPQTHQNLDTLSPEKALQVAEQITEVTIKLGRRIFWLQVWQKVFFGSFAAELVLEQQISQNEIARLTEIRASLQGDAALTDDQLQRLVKHNISI